MRHADKPLKYGHLLTWHPPHLALFGKWPFLKFFSFQLKVYGVQMAAFYCKTINIFNIRISMELRFGIRIIHDKLDLCQFTLFCKLTTYLLTPGNDRGVTPRSIDQSNQFRSRALRSIEHERVHDFHSKQFSCRQPFN